MARDIRQPTIGLDRCKYYKGEYTNGNKLSRAEEIEGVFYSKDIEGIRSGSEFNNGVKHIYKTVKIATNDYIPDLAEDYFVLYNDEYWLVTAIEREDIINDSRPFSRHSVNYIVSMKI